MLLHPSEASREEAAFTLIELLIVVAIIAILAAIAVPNFLEAQTRAKVSRVKNDMRALRTAVVSYQVDNNTVPRRRNKDGTLTFFPSMPETLKAPVEMGAMTTPIAYMTTLPVDVFDSNTPPPFNLIDYYDQVQTMWTINSLKFMGQSYFYREDEVTWTLVSVGPDGYLGPLNDIYLFPTVHTPPQLVANYRLAYDPTNGTDSPGNIYYNDDGGVDDAGIKLMEKFNRKL